MKIATLQKNRLFKVIALSTFLSTCWISKSIAWDGYDYANKVEIEIGPGNLVREGLIIQFYDGIDNSHHPAQVLLVESVPGGTRLEIKDLDRKKKRVFIMQN